VTTISGNSALFPISLEITGVINNPPSFASSLISTARVSIKKNKDGEVIEGESFSYDSPKA